MLKIALCDSNQNAVLKYAQILSDLADKHQIEITLSCFYSGESLLFHYTDDPEDIDMIYLDSVLCKMNGTETARKLRGAGCNAQIIFLTSCEAHVYEAFDVNALQYLIKEKTSPEKFEQVFLKAVELTSKKEEELFLFEFDGKLRVISIHEISYFEIWKRVVTVHYNKGQTAQFYTSMEQLEKKLADKNFVRTHRSYLVHLPYITLFQQQRLQLKTGEYIPIGITYAQSVKKKFSEYISRHNIFDLRNPKFP